jgi:hypothetical protein
VNKPNLIPRSIKIIRWMARIWSVVVTVFLLLIFFAPNSGGPGPIAAVDIFLLSLIGITLLGLLIAWRWELPGGPFAIAMLFIREITWVIIKGSWEIGFLILWVLIAPPAILYLIAWRQGRKRQPS